MRHLWLHHKIVPRGKHSFLNAARFLRGEQGKTTKIVHRTPMGQETYQQLSHDSAKWPPSLLAYLESGSLLTCGYTPLNKALTSDYGNTKRAIVIACLLSLEIFH
jgi:hypothetical protein